MLTVLFVYVIPLVIGWILLSKKNRGWGYYVVLALWPLIGLIVAWLLDDQRPGAHVSQPIPPVRPPVRPQSFDYSQPSTAVNYEFDPSTGEFVAKPSTPPPPPPPPVTTPSASETSRPSRRSPPPRNNPPSSSNPRRDDTRRQTRSRHGDASRTRATMHKTPPTKTESVEFFYPQHSGLRR